MSLPDSRVIVAGGRDFDDYGFVCWALEHYRKEKITIICGKARGADMLGHRWAMEHRVPVDLFPADWEGLGKRAGFVRNAEMVADANVLLAFWDGKSKGTKHVINLALTEGLEVHVYRYSSSEAGS